VTILLVLCRSTHDAIIIERFCRGQNIACTAVPVPREFSASCGIALQINAINRVDVQTFCDEKKISAAWYDFTAE
jgi:hypothetical protein